MIFARAAFISGWLALCAPSVLAAPEGPRLSLPLACTIGKTCEVQSYLDRDPGSGVQDYRCGPRTYDKHDGTDFRIRDMVAQRAGVDVLAAAAGKVSRARDGESDISIRAPGAPSVAGRECGNGIVVDHGSGWETQYCHLAKGSARVKAGDPVIAGQPLARVGLSGLTEFPHLHLTFRHNGKAVDPFAPGLKAGVCEVGKADPESQWSPAAAKALVYRRGAVLNSGFAATALTMDQVESGLMPPPTTASPALIAYVRAINLEMGDVQVLVIRDPSGAVVSQSRLAPLDHSKAQYLLFGGRKRPAQGWNAGTYQATYTVTRAGTVVLNHGFAIRL